MSASYVRQKFRDWAQLTSATVGVQYYDTVNVEVEPTDSVWWTAEFIAEQNEGTYCQKGFLETGFIRIVVCSQAGIGDTGGIDAIEKIVPDMMAHVDPTQRLVLSRYEPLNEDTGGSADRNYRVSVVIDYAHSL